MQELNVSSTFSCREKNQVIQDTEECSFFGLNVLKKGKNALRSTGANIQLAKGKIAEGCLVFCCKEGVWKKKDLPSFTFPKGKIYYLAPSAVECIASIRRHPRLC